MSFSKISRFITAYKAGVAICKKDYDKALSIYEKACKKDIPDQDIVIKYADLAIYCGKKDLCEQVLNMIDYFDIDDPLLKNAYRRTEGLLVWKKGDINKAIDIYKELLSEGEHSTVYETLGYLLIVAKRYDEALKTNEAAYEYNKDNNVIMDNLAESYYYTNQKDKAKELYELMFSKDEKSIPNFAESYYYYGLILKEENNTDEANKYFKKGLEMRESYLSTLKKGMIEKEITE